MSTLSPKSNITAWSILYGLVPLSLCDWPGHNTAVLFLGGCSLRCPTCHNAELAWRPERLLRMNRKVVETRLTASLPWLDGLVVTGGEPTEAPGLLPFLSDIKSFNLPIKLDTNGLTPDVVAKALADGLIDAVCVDVKGPFAMYPTLTGGRCTETNAITCLTYLFSLATKLPGVFTFRQTLVPLLTDRDTEHTRDMLPEGHTLILQTYRATGKYYANTNY